MKSYAFNRERYGAMAYIVQASPRRASAGLNWWPILRMAPAAIVLCIAVAVILKMIGA